MRTQHPGPSGSCPPQAFLTLVRREREAARRQREEEAKAELRRQEERRRQARLLDAAFDGDLGEIAAVLREVSGAGTGRGRGGGAGRLRGTVTLLGCRRRSC